MKIKLAILDPDAHFLSKISLYYGVHHSGDLSVSTYSTVEAFATTQSIKNFDVLWVHPEMSGLENTFEGAKNVVYISESKNIVTIHDKKAICKYQKPELIYKLFLQVYSEMEDSQKFGFSINSTTTTQLILVEGLIGGVGTTSLACSIAKKISQTGKKVLYFNPEPYNAIPILFDGEGAFGLSDVLYSFKSNKGNFGLKIKSFEKIDSSGVVFFDGWQMPSDRFQTTDEDILEMAKSLLSLQLYDCIVWDGALSEHAKWLKACDLAKTCIWVFDSSEKSKAFLEQRLTLFRAYAEQEVADLLPKTLLFANKCSSALDEVNALPYLGKHPLEAHSSIHETIASMMKSIDLSDWH